MYPTNLSHKPIVCVDNYDAVDGMYAGNSDAKALSIGRAQYDKNHISAKVFRHTGAQWSPQSEELPLHRVLDLASLIASLYYVQGAPSPIGNHPKTHANHLPPHIVSNNDMADLYAYLNTYDDILRPRLKELKDLLNGLTI